MNDFNNVVDKLQLFGCAYTKEKKIPCLELKYVRYQREKVGTKSILQIAANDVIASKKQKNTYQNGV